MSAPPGSNLLVNLVSGETAQVRTPIEVKWFNATKESYIGQLKFTETTDLRDLDRLLVLELMIFRWTQWLAKGQDYEGTETQDETVRKNIKEYSDQINKVKDSMGLAKKARDESAAEGNFSHWLSDLLSRAKIFGIHRQNQLSKALVLTNELSQVVESFDRSDEEERRKLGFENEAEIVDWIRTVMLPEFRAIDEYFRATEQTYWVRDM